MLINQSYFLVCAKQP